jgi:hypothetical protein
MRPRLSLSIPVFQDVEQWRTLADLVVDFHLHKKWRIPRTAERLLASHEGKCFMELITWISFSTPLFSPNKNSLFTNVFPSWRFSPDT